MKRPLPHILLLPLFTVMAFAAVELGNDLILKSVVLMGIICLCLYIRHIELAARDVSLAASERLFRTIVTESIPIVFMYDTDGKILLSEGRMLNTLDLKPKELVGKSVFEVYKDFPKIIEALETPLQGKHFEGVMQLGELFFEVFYTPNKNTQGKVTSVIGMALDITAHKQAELTRKASEERWKSLTESSSDHILLMDTDLNIEYINYTIPDLTIE
ncbi:MAG: PAS domain S-box protein, partial [Pseudomonadales bacterium]|nr:PAS domain S-box protein [Pseudomonadales bacterium]